MSSSRGNRSSRSTRSSRQRRSSRGGGRNMRGSAPQSRRGTLTRPDTGYSLHSRRVRRDFSNGGNPLAMLLRPRVLLLIAILVVVIVVMVLGVSSCMRRNSETTHQSVEETKPKNEQDERVAAGVSAAMTAKFTEALNEGEQLAQIAENADQYEDERMLELALNEPSSRAFIAAYPTSDKSSRPYDSDVSRGKIPSLFDWDDHWGAVTYGDGPLAVTGSGPTTLAMAYMGLTGKTDYTPTQIAQQANKNNYADGDSGSKRELFSNLATSLGLSTNEYDPSADTLSYSLSEETCIAIEVKEGTLTNEAHWILAVSVDESGAVTVYDPTSTQVSNTTWSAQALTDAANTFFAISASEATLAELDEAKTTRSAEAEAETGEEDDESATTGEEELTDEEYGY